MTVPFLEARFDECHTPRWTDATPAPERLVCGAPTISGRSYCAECRKTLIAGVIDKNGNARWFNPSTGARWRKPEDEESTTEGAESFLDSPTLGDAPDDVWELEEAA